jgi:hypothetical protein
MPGAVQLILFAIVMLIAALMMFRKQSDRGILTEGSRQAAWKIGLEGLAVGILTGLVGVGGGFLIVPALVLLGGLSMRVAIGTSLFIIALKSSSGFLKYLDVLSDAGLTMDWDLLLLFGGIGIVGSFAGRKVGQYISQCVLQKGFAVFLVLMSGFILVQNMSVLGFGF